jgi:hypothetical protein
MDISFENMLDREDIYSARVKILELEKENLELQQQLRDIKQSKELIEIVMFNELITKKEPRCKKHKTDNEVMFLNYCNQHRNNKQMKKNIRDKLGELGYIRNDGKVPWSIIKNVLENEFNKLDDEEKRTYFYLHTSK